MPPASEPLSQISLALKETSGHLRSVESSRRKVSPFYRDLGACVGRLAPLFVLLDLLLKLPCVKVGSTQGIEARASVPSGHS